MASSTGSILRTVVLLLILAAAAVVVVMQYMPRGELAQPAEKAKPATQQPATPAPQRQPTPTPRAPAPRYERQPETVLVSNSPSDLPISGQVAAAAEPVGVRTAEPSISSEAAVDVKAQPVVPVVVKEPAPVASAARPLPVGPVSTKVKRYAGRMLDRFDADGDGVIGASEWRQMRGSPAGIDYDADGAISAEELAAFVADFGRHRRMRLTGSMVADAAAELPPLYTPTAEWDAQAAAARAARQAAALPVALVEEAEEPGELGLLEKAIESQTVEQPADEPSEESGEEPVEESDDEVGEEVVEEVESPEPSEPAEPAAVGSKKFVTPKSVLSKLPSWFVERDANGDGQLSTAEYAPESEKSRLKEFTRFDRNRDGILTAEELASRGGD